MNDMDLFELLLMASPVVKAVMILLAFMSLAVWAVAFAKSYQIRKMTREARKFEKTFWDTQDLSLLYQDVENNRLESTGLALIFADGFREFVRLKQQGVQTSSDLINGSQRTMKIAFTQQSDKLENHLSFLATVGSSAPYIGLFGTVWGVMHAFQGLGAVEHATLAAVAPGISEALLATAIGLFAAIPAVIAYNRLSTKVDRLLNEYENFSEGFLSILQRQAHTQSAQ